MPKSRYVVSVDTTLRSHYGAPLPEGVEFSFTTDSFRVVSVQPANGQTNTSLQPLITVRYNAFVDIWTTPSGFRLTDLLGTRLTGGWRYPNPWTLTFEPHYPLAPNSVHTITVSDQILDLYGNPLDVPLVTTFTTGNPGRQEP
jgi:hypothetical protein